MADQNDDDKKFTFEISLSVLNHLGRSLYRSFATVMGEAISNAWDADAKNVEIFIDKNAKQLRDQGRRRRHDSRRFSEQVSEDRLLEEKGRTEIVGQRVGRSWAERASESWRSCHAPNTITVISRVSGGSWIGGVIDNSALDEAITEDLKPQQYPLGAWDHEKGRKIHARPRARHDHPFRRPQEGNQGQLPAAREDHRVVLQVFSAGSHLHHLAQRQEDHAYKHLKELADKTEFLWKIGEYDDPFVRDLGSDFFENPDDHETKEIEITGVRGFIASVEKPNDLKIFSTDERVGIDLFVNGRLRERDILKHIPTARIVESYMYGQIHFDELDDSKDRFTSSREGIVADDPKYSKFLETFRKEILKIVAEWDELRVKHREDGDPENPRLTKKQRASLGLFGAVSKEYALPKGSKKKREKVAGWVDDLTDDAAYNFESYADCFVSENLIRKVHQGRKSRAVRRSEAGGQTMERQGDRKARARETSASDPPRGVGPELPVHG